MKNLLLLLSLLVILTGIQSCKNDIDINGEEKELAVVYGVLDASDDVQYLKIGKSYLVNENAYNTAKDPTKLIYGTEISATITRYEKSKPKEIYTFTIDTIGAKADGVFFTSPNLVFKLNTSSPRLVNDPASEYRLTIRNANTGYEATSKVNLIDFADVNIDEPISLTILGDNSEIQFVKEQSTTYQAVETKFHSGKNGAIYFPAVRFFYTEVNNTTKEVKHLYLDWRITPVKAKSTGGGEKLSATFGGEDFYRFLGSKIKVDQGVSRFADSIWVYVEAGDDNFDTYYSINSVSSTTTLEKPFYTNINNGIGLFAAKARGKVVFKPKPYPGNVDGVNQYVYAGGLARQSQDSLACGIHTRKLRFAKFKFNVASQVDTVFCQ